MITEQQQAQILKDLISKAEVERFAAECVGKAWKAIGHAQNMDGSARAVANLLQFEHQLKEQLKAIEEQPTESPS